MDFGICINAIIPLRAAPTEKSEMTDQLLFGEDFQILETSDKWIYVRRLSDKYEGWLNSRYFLNLSDDAIARFHRSYNYILNLPFSRITVNESQLFLPAGSILPFFNPDSKTFRIRHDEYILHEELISSEADTRKIIKETAFRFLNAPYLWGGKTAFGIDCSGFTQIIYRIAGIPIPRDSHQQVNLGSAVNFVKDARVGDLAFFGDDEGRITHTGIMIGNQQLIHASGKVRNDLVDHQGIYNREIKQYTHKLRVVKRVIE